MLRSKSSGGQRAERKNRGGLKWTSRGRRQETKKGEGHDGGIEGWRGEGGGQSNLLPRANDVLPSPGRERETEPLPLIDVKCVIFLLLIKAGSDERRGGCGWERQKGSPTCLMGMARPLPMLSARPSRPFLSLSVSLAFLDCGKTTADNKSIGVWRKDRRKKGVGRMGGQVSAVTSDGKQFLVREKNKNPLLNNQFLIFPI